MGEYGEEYYGGEQYDGYGDQAVEVYGEDSYTYQDYGTDQYTENTEIVEDYTYASAEKDYTENSYDYDSGAGGGYYEEQNEDIQEESFVKKLSNKPPLPDGWVEMYDESMEAYYYLHEESGEASWVRPEEEQYDESGVAIQAPKRFGGEVKAYDYDEMTRTWNPNALASTGTAFATLRPRITPVVQRSLKPGAEENIMGTKSIHQVSEAEQEMKRLRVFDRHLRIKGKSKLQVTTIKKDPNVPMTMGAPRAPFNPEKRAEIRSIVNEDLNRAKRDLEVCSFIFSVI
jgi:hypothetical protein